MQIFTQKPSEWNFYICAMECEKKWHFVRFQTADEMRHTRYFWTEIGSMRHFLCGQIDTKILLLNVQ